MDDWLLSCGGGDAVERGGITRGAKTLGERGGSFGDVDPGFLFWAFPLLVSASGCSGIDNSAFSSIVGPDIPDTMLSPNTFRRQLLPGALIDLSCKGGRPGIVAISGSVYLQSRAATHYLRESIASSCTVVI